MKERVLLGMSGGVDSSYSIIRLREAGYEVEGAILIMSDATDTAQAEKAAAETGVTLHKIDCRRIFGECVINTFVREYTLGRTPNTCIDCNPNVKFASLIKTADSLGIDKIATGHYAKIGYAEGRYFIKRGDDAKKDQSYMLYRLPQDILSRTVFPLGELCKPQVRTEAAEAGLSSSSSSDSNEICFIPDNDHASYIEKYNGTACKKGYFTDRDGNILGEHGGICRYTVGQRKGLGISLGRQAFVCGINASENTVVLSYDEADLFSGEFSCAGLSYMKLPPDAVTENMCLDVKVRYAAKPVPATVSIREGKAYAKLGSPARAITPGQSAVFYDGDGIAFGGYIE